MATNALTKRGGSFPNPVDDFFKPWNEWFGTSSLWGNVMNVPAVNVKDEKDSYMISLAAPGLKKEDFTIAVEGNILTISSEKEQDTEEKDEKYTRKEYNYSSFSRSFTLPEEVSKERIVAVYEEGVLKLTLPKNDAAKKAAEARQIVVK